MAQDATDALEVERLHLAEISPMKSPRLGSIKKGQDCATDGQKLTTRALSKDFLAQGATFSENTAEITKGLRILQINISDVELHTGVSAAMHS